MGKKNVKWVIFFTVLIIVCIVVFLFITKNHRGNTVQIYVNDELVKEIYDISGEEVQSCTIETDEGYNKICWQNGSVWVEEADCTNQTCVNFGKLSVTGVSIICAPHRLVIKIV